MLTVGSNHVDLTRVGPASTATQTGHSLIGSAIDHLL